MLFLFCVALWSLLWMFYVESCLAFCSRCCRGGGGGGGVRMRWGGVSHFCTVIASKAVFLLWFLTVTCSCCPYLYFGSAIMLVTYFDFRGTTYLGGSFGQSILHCDSLVIFLLRFGKRELDYVFLMQLFVYFVRVVLSFFSSAWCQGLAAACARWRP